MAELLDINKNYVADFERLESAGGPGWLLELRRNAMARFRELGFPTTRDEEWRFTPVAPIARTAFDRAVGAGVGLDPGRLSPYLFDDEACLAVFVDGVFAPEISSLRGLPSGVRMESLAEAVTRDETLIRSHLGRQAPWDAQPFTALNTALLEDGAFVHVSRETVMERPLHLLFVCTSPGRPVMTHPRNLIVAETSSQVQIVESYVGLGNGVYFTNAVTEIVAADNTVVDHYKVGREGPGAFHVATLQVGQGRSSDVASHTITLGGSLVRNDINARLGGEGAECTLNGFYVVGGSQHVDNHLFVDHAVPHGNSREYFRGILDGQARGVFSGRIFVRENAQKTDAKQSNASLLLSPDAQIESMPQLEILADDVKCTHGATVGQVSEEAIFYLRSRGLTDKAAHSLLVYAFARESIAHVRFDALRICLERLFFERLPHGHVLLEAQ